MKKFKCTINSCNKMELYRKMDKGAYKNQWEKILSPRDKELKELRQNKELFVNYKEMIINIEKLQEIIDYCKINNIEFIEGN